MVALFDEFKSTKNKEKRKTYHAIFEQKEKDRVKRRWKEKKMHELQKHIYIYIFNFVENYYVSKNISKNNLNMVKKNQILLKKIILLLGPPICPLIQLLLTVKGLR